MAETLKVKSFNTISEQSALNFQLATRYVDALAAISTSNNAKVIAMPAELAQSIGGLINAGVVLGSTTELNQN